MRHLRAGHWPLAAILFAALIDMSVAVASPARDGLLDPGFGQSGRVTITAAESPEQPFGAPYIQDVAADARGRIYLLTWASSPGDTRPAVIRLDRSGRVDPSYGVAGRSIVPTVGLFDSINLFPALEVDGEGNALVAAIRRREDSSYCTALHRLRADGSHDDAFLPFPPSRCTDFGSPLFAGQSAWAIALDHHEGRLLLTGPTERAGTVGTGIARLEADGSPVAGFGVGGLLRPGANWSWGVAIDGGRTIGYDGFCLRALDPTGTLEPGFGTNGCADLFPHGRQTFPQFLVRDEANRILPMGRGFGGLGGQLPCKACMTRRLPNGAADLTFNAAGLSVGPPGWVYLWPPLAGQPQDAVPRSVMTRRGSRLFVSADFQSSGNRFGQILSISAAGAPDLRFGPEATPGQLNLSVDGPPSSQIGIVADETPAGMIVVLSPIPSTATEPDRHVIVHLIDDLLLADGLE
jgi:hypothetical protein